MGNWKMEVYRMAMYIAFPVTVFFVFNQPQIYEKYVIETKKEYYPEEDLERVKRIEALKEKCMREHQDKLIAEMEKNYS